MPATNTLSCFTSLTELRFRQLRLIGLQQWQHNLPENHLH